MQPDSIGNEVVGKVVLCDFNTEIYVCEQLKEVERVGAYAAILIIDLD